MDITIASVATKNAKSRKKWRKKSAMKKRMRSLPRNEENNQGPFNTDDILDMNCDNCLDKIIIIPLRLTH